VIIRDPQLEFHAGEEQMDRQDEKITHQSNVISLVNIRKTAG
jgi:hypothetical protein